MKWLTFFGIMVVCWTGKGCRAQQLELASSGKTLYHIVIPDEATATEREAASFLQSYIRMAARTEIPVVPEQEAGREYVIFIGQCNEAANRGTDKADLDGFAIIQDGNRLFLTGHSGQGTFYAVTYFLEKYLGCRKYDATPAVIPRQDRIVLPAGIHEVITPAFAFRQSYYSLSNDPEYLRWHGLQRFEDLWGLWGHSFFKLIPPSRYFKSHPEYFALVDGQRRATQLCLSNEEVLQLTIARLKEMMADNPDALYWSVSPNDEGGYCTCDLCRPTDEMEGGPSGSLIRFVNKVAAAFPDKNITTLGYGYTALPPSHTKPAENVYILVSSIAAYKEQPVSSIPSASAFRRQLAGWAALTGNIFVWDYATQFTHYLAPFPVQHIFRPDFTFYREQQVRGIFEQGSGDTYSDMAELNSYLQAKLFWNVDLDVKTVTEDFCKGYYGKAASYVLQYLDTRTQALLDSKRHLDIYGSPASGIRGYLSPENINLYDQLLEKAQNVVEGTLYEDRVRRVRLSLDYTVLQQSRHFGVEKYGFLEDNGGSFYSVKEAWKKKVSAFTLFAKTAGVTELAEAGLSPDAYREEWNTIFSKIWIANPVRKAAVSLQYEFSEDFPAKGKTTLTDGMTGFDDFSYNWLCFYGQDMIATIDAGKEIPVGRVHLNFLEDQRHWIFPAETVVIEISSDGANFREWKKLVMPPLSEKDKVEIIPIAASATPQKARYIRVSAACPRSLPGWRNHPDKKPMIACDEIFVLP